MVTCHQCLATYRAGEMRKAPNKQAADSLHCQISPRLDGSAIVDMHYFELFMYPAKIHGSLFSNVDGLDRKTETLPREQGSEHPSSSES